MISEHHDDILIAIRAKYPLAAMFIDDVIRNLSLREAIMREKVINSLRLILTKFDYDRRWYVGIIMIASMCVCFVCVLRVCFVCAWCA